MDDAAWAALTLSLTVLGGIWTWVSFRRRGAVSGLRALGFTLLPLAAYLTDTLQMFTRIVDEITSWATHLVLSPSVWAGVVIGGIGIALILGSGMMRTRRLGAAGDDSTRPLSSGPAAGRTAGRAVVTDDDPELAEIEAMLRKRGIT